MFLTRKKIIIKAYYRRLLRIQNARKIFREFVKTLPLKSLLFQDEMHCNNKDFVRKYGRGFASNKPSTLFHKLSRESFTLILTISYFGIIYFEVHKSSGYAINSNCIYTYMKNLYIYKPNNTLLLLDNATVHQNDFILNLFENLNLDYLFLSGYSPDYTPIEKFFNYIKIKLKNYYDKDIDIPQAIKEILENTPSDIFKKFYENIVKNWNSDEK
jgi:transposase